MTNAPNDDGLGVLAVFNRPGPHRLTEVVAALNPRPRPRRAMWFGGPVLDRWRERNAEIFATVASLAETGMLRQTHSGRTLGLRQDQYRDKYAITEAGCYTLTGTQFNTIHQTERAPTVPTRYRKLPVEIDAVRWTGDNGTEMWAFAPGKFQIVVPQDRTDDPDITAQVFDELHSTWVGMRTGQWVLKGVVGEFYPCADHVFAATYEPVDAVGSPA